MTHQPPQYHRRPSLLRQLRFKEVESRRFKTAIILTSILTGAVAFFTSGIFLKNLTEDDFREGLPVNLGRIQGIDVLAHIGDIAIPNQIHSVWGRPDRYALDSRKIFWEAYMITAPVPKEIPSPTGIRLEIPWTLLPASVCQTVFQVDSLFGLSLESWLGLKRSPAEWHFDRISFLSVPETTRYHRLTGLSRIYSVNLFDFLNELGGDYKSHLSKAISSATKEVIQSCGRIEIRKLAIPAVAAAQQVREQDLVLSYRSSYGAILDGLSRASGNTPSQVVLVVWSSLRGTRELESSLNGLRLAAFDLIPEYTVNLRTVATTIITLGVLLGAFISYKSRNDLEEALAWPILFAMLAVLPTMIDFFFLKWFLGVLPASSRPDLDCGLIASTSVLVGAFLDRKGNIMRKHLTGKQGAST